MQRINGWLGVSILGLVLWTALPGYGQYTITNIAYATLEVGYYPADTTTIYQVTGRIVSPSLATNKTLIYMVDTNDNSGIAVRLDSTVDPGTFAIGREAYARGLVQQTNGERYIYCQYAAWFAQTDPVAKTVAPVPLSIAAALANPEQYESSLVLFTNCTIAAGTCEWPVRT